MAPEQESEEVGFLGDDPVSIAGRGPEKRAVKRRIFRLLEPLGVLQ